MANQDNPHFMPIFWYISATTVLSFVYFFVTSFLPVPKENQRTVDMVTGFLIGSMVSAGIGYLLGGNPTNPTAKAGVGGTTTADISATITQTPKDEQKPQT